MRTMTERRSAPRESSPLRRWFAVPRRLGQGLLLAVLPFATGIGLVLTIVIGYPLLPGVLAIGLLGVAGLVYTVRNLTPPARRDLGRRARRGIVAAAVATALYDVSRFAAARTVTPEIDPFAAWPVFGELIVGGAAGPGLTLAVGVAFHVTNGVCFGIAYVLVMPRPGILTGVAWGLGLELAMALLYPSWLRIDALQEFLTLSVVGHVVYGGTLGFVARRLLQGAMT